MFTKMSMWLGMLRLVSNWILSNRFKIPFFLEKTTPFFTTTSTTTTSTTTYSSSLFPSSKPFPDCLFRYGRNFRKDVFDYSHYDYISLWLGKINSFCPDSNSRNQTCTDFDISNGRDELAMLKAVKDFQKMAVFKSFIIGFEGFSFIILFD